MMLEGIRTSIAHIKKLPFCSVQSWYAAAVIVWPVWGNAFQERCGPFRETPGTAEVWETQPAQEACLRELDGLGQKPDD